MLTFLAQNSTNDVLSNPSKMASWYCKEKIDVDKLAGAERVKEWLVTAYQLQCKLAALNFLLETSSLLYIIFYTLHKYSIILSFRAHSNAVVV